MVFSRELFRDLNGVASSVECTEELSAVEER